MPHKDDYMYIDVNWDSFKLYNQSAKGVRYKFEDLCRQLFANENLAGNKRYRHLHSNPNNPGLETEPIYDEVNKRWVGFQAKYFDVKADWILRCGGAASPVWREPAVRTNGAAFV